MKNIHFFLSSCFIICLISLIFVRPAAAYLDPGTGSYVFQLLIAAFVGGMFAIKHHFVRIKNTVKKMFTRGKDE